MKPLRKNSYSKGAKRGIEVQIVQKSSTVQAVFGRFERANG
jgi:hypothetical protein